MVMFGASLLGLLWLLLLNGVIAASEGKVLLENQIGGPTKCLAYSVETKVQEWNVLVTCQNQIYPPVSSSLDNYFVWVEGGNTDRPALITQINSGKGQGLINTAFERMFVTIENSARPRNPAGEVVMSGRIQPMDFNQIPGGPTSTPTPTPQETKTSNSGNQTETESTDGEISRPFWQTTFGKVVMIVTVGFLIFILIVVVYGRRG